MDAESEIKAILADMFAAWNGDNLAGYDRRRTASSNLVIGPICGGIAKCSYRSKRCSCHHIPINPESQTGCDKDIVTFLGQHLSTKSGVKCAIEQSICRISIKMQV